MSTKSKKIVVQTKSKKLKPTIKKNEVKKTPEELLFGRNSYKFFLIGFGLVALGLISMLGGNIEDPNVWDESIIYNPRITVLGPILVLLGLGVNIYAIFKR